jgi:tRNA nucleotidyltransferase (CCA-adding enzyme)
MKTYLVGGAVRDALLGLPVQDRDWVVVGATTQAMLDLGFTPVGKDFPVFLHPQTHEEHALARTERNSAPGYKGFVVHASPEVTLEEDLARRDLTINAIAQAPDGTLIDPFNGQQDLKARVLRHVSGAFAEDPVRILRVARLAARFADFSVAPETVELMREMVRSGEADALVPERVWQELSRGLMEQRPSRLFETLRGCGALKHLLPEVDALWGVPQRADHHPEIDTGWHLMMVLDMAARLQANLATRFACLCHDLGKAGSAVADLPRHLGHEARSARLLARLCTRWRVPLECRDLADLVAREHGNIHRSEDLGAASIMRLLERCDALRRPARFLDALLACEADARGRLGLEEQAYGARPRLEMALRAAQAVPTGDITQQALARGLSGEQIGDLVRQARLAGLDAMMPR